MSHLLVGLVVGGDEKFLREHRAELVDEERFRAVDVDLQGRGKGAIRVRVRVWVRVRVRVRVGAGLVFEKWLRAWRRGGAPASRGRQMMAFSQMMAFNHGIQSRHSVKAFSHGLQSRPSVTPFNHALLSRDSITPFSHALQSQPFSHGTHQNREDVGGAARK